MAIRLLFILVVAVALVRPGHAADVHVLAAASLKESMDDQARRFEAATANRVVVSYGASSALARQVEAGSPADIFISADADWMDYLEARRLLKPASRVGLVGNALVLIAPVSSTVAVDLARGTDIGAALDGGKLAMANPDSVPAGKYGKAALTSIGAWERVKPNVARAENVRAALLFVSRGEARLGIVYRTDAIADPSVRIVATFADDTHPAIVYPAALLAGSRSAAAADLLAALQSPDGRARFARFGFSAPAQ